MELDQEFLEFVVKALVDTTDDVKVVRRLDEMGVLLTLDVNPEDMGKVIGRQGNTAKAIRTLLRVVGMKNNARVNLKVNEPAGGSRMISDDQGGGSSADNSNDGEPGPATKSVDEATADLNL